MRLEIFLDLHADRQDRVQRGHRLLEDHGDFAAARAPKLFLPHRHEVAAVPFDLAAHMAGLVHEPHQRAQRDALAASRFADETEHLALRDVQIDAVDGARQAARRLKGRRQPANLECQPSLAHRFVLNSSATPSPSRLKPRPVMTMAMPGNTEIHHAVVMKFLPSAISTPHSAVGGWAPRPR